MKKIDKTPQTIKKKLQKNDEIVKQDTNIWKKWQKMTH